MIEADYSPGRIDRFLRALPDGFVLRLVFYTLLALASGMVALDVRRAFEAAAVDDRLTRTEPLPLPLPRPGDQIRPYLPRATPVGPERGLPDLPGLEGPAQAAVLSEPMRFLPAPGGVASAVGRIEIGMAERLTEFLDSPAGAGTRTLHLHSPGGSVADAIAMARTLRARGIETVVPADGYCASACPLLFSGGVERRAGRNAWIGLHQVYALDAADPALAPDLDRSISDVQTTIAECQQLLADMGVKPALWIKAMRTPPAELYVLTLEEMQDVSLVSARPVPAA
ncbi:ATP-dependent Clp protease proteolytic subunit [Aurantimonas sp. Leaf443]|uniref:ATP-dependent Clp protease proteolytic subunit n=1 Tax=Aurantimonas sp. Leaf443 TaxID=1736378 RepID=UPI000701ED57|nr:ATP-dependent Clp protease proteolytic subunit [Aurantimonas sp. Leaf443]KQT86032.1 hypothetical protein ASG48_05455 [Aurantimonas sp. Leaf443]